MGVAGSTWFIDGDLLGEHWQREVEAGPGMVGDV